MKITNFFTFAIMVMMFTAIFNVRANANDLTPIPLEVRIFDPTLPKSPVQIPIVYITNYTLTFDESCDSCILRLVNDDDEVEYVTVITSNTLILPSTLEGEYEIQIIRDNWCFYGYIEL